MLSSFWSLSAATDIFDKELNDARKNRWNIAFSDYTAAAKSLTSNSADRGMRDLTATIVIEHIVSYDRLV